METTERPEHTYHVVVQAIRYGISREGIGYLPWYDAEEDSENLTYERHHAVTTTSMIELEQKCGEFAAAYDGPLRPAAPDEDSKWDWAPKLRVVVEVEYLLDHPHLNE